jgi:hypothetical protein
MKLITFIGAQGYNKLAHLPFNRNFKVRADLTNSMNERGFIVPINLIKTDLITGKEELYIADGQNRAITAAFLNIDFYGVVSEIPFKDVAEIVSYVSTLNSSHKAWTSSNYAESYAYLGMENYISLIRYTQKSPYTINTIAAMLYGNKTRGGVGEKIQNGTFKINYLQQTVDTLALASRLSAVETLTSRMIIALYYVSSLSTFNEEKFIKSYKANSKMLRDLKLDDYTDIFTSWT